MKVRDEEEEEEEEQEKEEEEEDSITRWSYLISWLKDVVTFPNKVYSITTFPTPTPKLNHHHHHHHHLQYVCSSALSFCESV